MHVANEWRLKAVRGEKREDILRAELATQEAVNAEHEQASATLRNDLAAQEALSAEYEHASAVLRDQLEQAADATAELLSRLQALTSEQQELESAAVDAREKEIGGSGVSLEPPGLLLTQLHAVCMAYSECLPTLLTPLAERTCFSQVDAQGRADRATAHSRSGRPGAVKRPSRFP